MKSKLSLISTLAAVLAVALLVWLKPFASPQAPAVPPVNTGQVVAKIGGTPVFFDQIQSRYSSLSSIHGSDVEASQLKREILHSFVQEVAIAKGAAEEGVSITPVELALYVAGVTSGFQSDPEAMAGFLKASNATLPQLEARVFLNFLASRLYLQVTGEASITDEEVQAYYSKHHSDFTVPSGSTPQVAFEAVKPEIAANLLKQKQDRAWATWLDQRAKKYTLDVVMEDWWTQIKKATPPPPLPGQGATPSISPGTSPSTE